MNLDVLDNLSIERRRTERSEDFQSRLSRGSLTVHRRCCLPGGATRGLEAGGWQTRRQSTPEAGKFQGRNQNVELLKAIAASRVFIEFERAFTEATGLPVALRPVESFQLSFHDLKTQGPFCALMARANRTCGACLQSQSQVAEAGSERPHTNVCYASLCETVVPLRLGSRLIGFLSTGQVFLRKPDEAQFRRVLKVLSNWGMELGENVLREAYFKTQVVSRQRHAAAVKLLTIFAEHLAMLSNQILIQRDHAEPQIVAKAKDFIREHHTEDLSLPQVARFANTSPFYFCKLFKRVTGLTFTHFLARVRIESSKVLLINPQLRVSEVAFEVGFQSLTHFNRVFHKILGQSPTEYRQKLQESRKLA